MKSYEKVVIQIYFCRLNNFFTVMGNMFASETGEIYYFMIRIVNH